MTATGEFMAVMDDMFADVRSVADQVNVIETTYDALLDTVEEFGSADPDNDEAMAELLVAAIGATSACLRVLKMHLESMLNPPGLETTKEEKK
jgi:hypothetical protein